MTLVIGRGKNRRVFFIPCGDIVKRADSEEVSALIDNMCTILGLREKE